MIATVPAYKFDWPQITVEAYKDDQNRVIMVFNLDVTSPEKINCVVQYVAGRTVWCWLNIPVNTGILLSFDFRGQNITDLGIHAFEKQLIKILDNTGIGNLVSTKFLI